MYKIDIQDSIYNNFRKIAEEKPNNLAYIDYRTGQKVTYGELVRFADGFANSMFAMGIGSDNNIGVLSFNSQIDPIAILGGNKLGATVVFVDPDNGIPTIKSNVSYLDILVIEDVFVEIEPEINSKKIPTIILGQTNKKMRYNCLSYENFIETGDPYDVSTANMPDKPSLVIFSSDTTGVPKPIVHSNFTVNSAVQKMLYTDFTINNNYLIKVIPSHIGLGSITSMLTALLTGTPYIQLKSFPNPEDLFNEVNEVTANFKTWLRTNKLSVNAGLLLFVSPIFARMMLREIDKFKDLSHLKGILLGDSK